MSIKKSIFIFMLCAAPALYSFSLSKKKVFTIMLDPAGDAQHAGRNIGNYFERGITLQCAEALKKSLEETVSHIRVVLTRFPGETIQPRQNASFANRLDVDLYISLHFFKQTTRKPIMHILYFCSDPVTDFWQSTSSNLSFIKSNEIHKGTIKKSKQWCTDLFTTFEEYKDIFKTTKPLGIPFKPLYGLKSPSIALEVSLTHPNKWESLLEPLTHGISEIITTTKKESRTRGFFS